MNSILVFSFVGGLLIGGIGMILAVATLAEALQRLLATDWAGVAEDIENPVRAVPAAKENV